MLRERIYKNQHVGFEAQHGNALFFFGTRHAPLVLIKEMYPHLEFCVLKQVHGNKVVEADPKLNAEADGHTTKKINRALVIKTADCLPILASGEGQILALHAGWRGLESKIIGVGFECGKFEFAAIGPHIRAASYEVDMEVANRLAAVAAPSAIQSHPIAVKRFIDLTQIATAQLQAAGCDPLITPGDTFMSSLYYSYRKGKEKEDRQYSFVALLKD